jgi:hypothetical protein
VCRTIDKFDESLEKSVDSVDKLDDDIVELEKISTYLVEMMKDEGYGDNDIWMSKEYQNAFEPLIKSNYFHMDVHEQGYERNGACEQDE